MKRPGPGLDRADGEKMTTMVTAERSDSFPMRGPAPASGVATDRRRVISVLFVDDTPALVNLLSGYLQKDGDVMVNTAFCVEEAVEKLKTVSFDVIVTDYNNKEMKGNQLLRYVRDSGSGTPFVYYVLFRIDKYEEEAKKLGGVSFIEKLGPKGPGFVGLSRTIMQVAGRN